MIRCDYHIHTVFSDGANTPREMVESAIKNGFTEIGFSDHSYTDIDESYCMQKERIPEYIAQIRALQKEYAGRIKIKCGIEQDLFSKESTDNYDYFIGSVHYFKIGNEYLSVDESKESVEKTVQKYFGGDYYALAELYFGEVASLAELDPDIIGHFDLISKYNEDDRLFDSHNERYLKAGFSAIDTLLKCGKPFEINTGAISRGYRKTPYPSDAFADYIRAHGGRFILSSDSHGIDTIGYRFEQFVNKL